MSFVARKIITYLLNPLSIIVVLLLFFSLKRSRKGVLLCAVLLYLCGTTFFADMLIRPLEKSYSIPKIEPTVNYVVVLTGDMFSRKTALSSSGCSSTQRLLTAVSVCKHLNNCTIILSGGSLFGERAGSLIWGEILKSFGNYTYIA